MAVATAATIDEAILRAVKDQSQQLASAVTLKDSQTLEIAVNQSNRLAVAGVSGYLSRNGVNVDNSRVNEGRGTLTMDFRAVSTAGEFGGLLFQDENLRAVYDLLARTSAQPL